MKTVFVVGNKFRDFARNEGVVTIGDLAEMVRTSSFERLASGSRLVAGQRACARPTCRPSTTKPAMR